MHPSSIRAIAVRALLMAALLACGACSKQTTTAPATADHVANTASLDSLSEAYVRLALTWGEHDPDYVDAYYGPAKWREQSKLDKAPVETLQERARALARQIAQVPLSNSGIDRERQAYLVRQLEAMAARIDVVRGVKSSFDAESRAIFDAQAPAHDAAYFDGLLRELDAALPGKGTTSKRFVAFRNRFVIPPARLDAVLKRAIAACRERTLAHMQLPPGETFTLEYVTKKSWSGYNSYQGGYHSLIQVNTDLPVFIDRAIDLACHEGYPGHHVYATLLEQRLVRERGWQEFTLAPLFSPSGVLAEGSANYGIELAFPGDERWQFERDELYPLAGLDPREAQHYYRVTRLAAKLDYAVNEAARSYLDGKIDAQAAQAWLERYALLSPERARQRLGFIEQYRAYVINYNLGLDLVREHIEAVGGTDANSRWAAFEKLLSTPMTPSALRSHPQPRPM